MFSDKSFFFIMDIEKSEKQCLWYQQTLPPDLPVLELKPQYSGEISHYPCCNLSVFCQIILRYVVLLGQVDAKFFALLSPFTATSTAGMLAPWMI